MKEKKILYLARIPAINRNMKSAHLLRGVVFALLLQIVSSVHAFYDPSLGRWLNRDPIGEVGGVNLYQFVSNSPVNFVDPFGFDIWIVKDEGGWGHETIVGQNPDGSYWDSGEFPGKGVASPIFCTPDIRFRKKSPIDPTDPKNPNKFPPGSTVRTHIPTTPDMDKKLRDIAIRYSITDPGKYIPGVSDCNSYACFIARQARPQLPPITFVPSNPYLFLRAQ